MMTPPKVDGLRLRGDLMLVRPTSYEQLSLDSGTATCERMANGLYLAYNEATRSTRGTVVAVGPMCKTPVGALVLYPDREIEPPTCTIADDAGELLMFHEPALLCRLDVVPITD